MLSSGSWRKRTTSVGSGHNRFLKILHIDPERNWGGGEVQVVGLLAYLSGRGHDNTLLAHPHGRLFEHCGDLNIARLPLFLRNDLDLRPVASLRRLICEGNYDIVHLHTKRAHALSLWLPRQPHGPKYVVTRRMDYPERKGWYTRYLYNRRIDGIVAISQPILQLLVSAGIDAKRIRLIHSGINSRPFESVASEIPSLGDVPVVGTVAVLEERKGHRFLLEAAARLKSQGYQIKYYLAGDGSLRGQLEEMVKRLKLTNEVKFYGFVSDTPAFLARIDLFVLPSLHEGLGVAALEAMAAGKAVVASRAGGLAELVLDPDTGLLVSPGDSEALADAIAKLVSDRSLARVMGNRGADRVRGHFTLEQMALKNEAYYYDLLERSA
jgi:glycosyltransferase involved in cell wall biosynthesis